jgi:EAL domain-containing protein (putative c-di-GMP-specific phosphodiesterase class I)
MSPRPRFRRAADAPDPRSAAVAQLLDDLLAQDPSGTLAEAVVRAARVHLGMELAFLSEFVGDTQFFRVVDGDAASFDIGEGATLAMEASYCPRMSRGDLPNAIPDLRADPLARDLPITSLADIGAYIGVPVRLADGRLYGTLCGLSHTRCPDLRDRDVRFLQVLAAVVADDLSRHAGRADERRRQVEDIARVLSVSRLAMAFQPIVRLADGALVGMEALARFPEQEVPERGPDRWFAMAWDVGLGVALELLAIESALAALPRLPADAYLAVNADPRTVVSDGFDDVVADHDLRRVLLEFTEHTPVEGYDELRAAMAKLRRRGVRFAVDDAGAGYSGLNHMVRVAPDVIKLDRFLTAGVDADPARRALTASAASFARTTGTTLIAEGVETAEELATLRSIGVRFGQGFLLGRPSVLDTDAQHRG